MSPWLSNVPASSLLLFATVATSVREDVDILATQGRQKRHMPNDSVAGCSSTKDRKISDFSIKTTSASETGIAAVEQEKHQFNQCSKAFQSSMNPEQHTGNVHVTEPGKKHQDCENTSKNEKSLKVHGKNKRGNRGGDGYQCEQCGQVLSLYDSLKRHKASVHETVPREQCPDCKRTFKRKIFLRKHMKYEHGAQKRIRCDQCNKLFRSFGDLTRHTRDVHLMKSRWECVDCKQMFEKKECLIEHQFNEHDGYNKQYSCDQCSALFRNSSRLKQHIDNVHTTGSGQECPDCKQYFETRQSLAHHRASLHGDNRKHICDECGRGFLHPSHLIRHVQDVHVAESKQRKKCDNCTQTFKNEKSLYSHMRKIHGGYKKHDTHEKQYERDQRNQTFAIPSTSSQGSPTRASERTHECFDCHITCESASMLAKHILIEHKPRRRTFACEECGLRFFYRSEMNRHMLAHSGEKQFECQICNKKLASKSSLTRHQKAHVIL